MKVRVGTSGWNYPEWRGAFYPDGLVHRRELAYLAERLNSVELNGSFYSLQRPSSYRRWAADTPPDFRFAVKGGRYLTHLKRLVDFQDGLANFFASGVLALGARLGPVLWQFPANLTFDADRLDRFLAALPYRTTEAVDVARRHTDKLAEDRVYLETDADREIRHAIEPRHDSFGTPEALAVLRAHNVAMVAADTAGTWPYFEELTADFGYVRLHGHTELYHSDYAEPELSAWVDKIRSWDRDTYVYFDNTDAGHAPGNALTLAEMLSDR
jgi:uncharacterized protein YecE (DUF72 family)